MKNMTQAKFFSLPLHKQTEIYFTHPDNLTNGKNNSQGPSYLAQARFIADWQIALHEFALASLKAINHHE